MTPEPQRLSPLEDVHRSTIEQARQQRAERWIFIRELAIAILVAAVVAARFALGA